eukprot:gene10928-3633_t
MSNKKDKKQNLFNLLDDNDGGDFSYQNKKTKKKIEEKKKPEFEIKIETTETKKKKKNKKKQPQPKEETQEEKILNDLAIKQALKEIEKETEIEQQEEDKFYEEEFEKFVGKIKSILKEGYISAIDAFSICETISEHSTSNKQQKAWIDECQREIIDYYSNNKKGKNDFQTSYEMAHKIYKFNLKKRNISKK